MPQNTVYIETYGCQMNVYDTELVHTILDKAGYSVTKSVENANIIFLNTCSVRENANQKIFNRVHTIRRENKTERPIIGLLGCMATNLRKKLFEMPGLNIDIVAGPDSYKHLPNLIKNVQETGDVGFHVTLSEMETYSDVFPTKAAGVNAWIAIMRGCNNYCTFCVVPHTRGRERSRSPQNILEEATKQVQSGTSQITLLGQNVNSYRYEDTDFTELMAILSQIDGLKRLRFTSPHPKDYPDKLLTLMANTPNICNQIHLPLQSGNTRILDMMNRTYSKEEYLSLVKKIRTTIPDVVLTTDIIIGFPTETDKEFEDTVDVVNQSKFNAAFIFKYSERKNTLASKKYPDDISDSVKKSRIMKLDQIQKNISLSENRSFIGKTEDVLIEQKGTKKDPNAFQGRTNGNTIVILSDGPHEVGKVIPVHITDATANILKGKPVIS